MSEVSPIEKSELSVAHRRMCRRIAAVLIQAMAETDMSFADIAQRLGTDVSEIDRTMDALISGEGGRVALSNISDITFAMNCEIRFQIVTPPKQVAEGE